MAKSKRIPHLDLLKFLAIFLVLLGHATEQTSADLFWDHPVWSFIYSFHMPLFMFLCGYFFLSSLSKPFLVMLKKKFIQLGIPSITAFLIQYLIMLLTNQNAIADLCERSFMGFMNAVWFLKCVLLCYVIMYPMCKLVKNDMLASLIAVILILLLPGADIVNLNFMLPFFCLGIIIAKRQEQIQKHRWVWTAIFCALFFILLPFWSGRLTVYMVPTRLLTFSPISLDFANLQVTLLRLLIGLSGTMACYFLIQPVYVLVERTRICPTLLKIGGATLGIYFLQTFLLEILIHCLHIYIPIPWSYPAVFLLAILELVLCFLLVRLIRKNTLLKLLLLGEDSRIK